MSVEQTLSGLLQRPPIAAIILFRGGIVALIGAAGWRVFKRGLTLEAGRVMLQNTWVVLSIYVAAVAADSLLPVGYIVSSLAGLVGGLVASQSLLYIGTWRGWFERREQLLTGWVLLGVGGLVIHPLIAGPLTMLWLVLWMLCAAMSVYSAAKISSGTADAQATLR